MEYSTVILTALLLAVCNAQLRYFSTIEDFQNSLQPVQGLYVKPSDDGETGDLFVAASENDGVQTPWVADTAVKMVPPPPQISEKEEGSQYTSITLPEENQRINKGNVAAVSLRQEPALPVQHQVITEPEPTLDAKQLQYIQVPQLFYSLLAASAAAEAASRVPVEKPESSNAVASLAENFMQGYPYPYVRFVVVDPEAWAQDPNQAKFIRS